jgi:L-seryl-tRNA(Ser) seleniumtransferase
MRSQKALNANSILRNLPSVDELSRSATGHIIAVETGERHASALARKAIEILRSSVVNDGEAQAAKHELLEAAERHLESLWLSERLTGITRVINATGVIVHTNLGRAPLAEAARRVIAEHAAGYCTLEYDLETGKRGRRGGQAEDLIIDLTGAEDALIVNNCAAAAYFILHVFASGGEVVISRGELVEIGGDFRVPDVLAESGARLNEVGTTNRTKLADYTKAINDATRMILRVHPSNYRIVGFTAAPSVAELAAVAREHNIILYEDIGSGALVDLSEYGLTGEPVVSRSITDGADVVSFSGDKLLGGPQAGIIAGKREIVERLRRAPLYRALRVDKLTCAALEATLKAHRRGTAVTEVPVLSMLAATADDISRRTRELVKKLPDGELKFEIVNGMSAVGGGSAPTFQPETVLISLEHRGISATLLEQKLRSAKPPVITRIVDGRVMIDLRTVPTTDEAELVATLKGI